MVKTLAQLFNFLRVAFCHGRVEQGTWRRAILCFALVLQRLLTRCERFEFVFHQRRWNAVLDRAKNILALSAQLLRLRFGLLPFGILFTLQRIHVLRVFLTKHLEQVGPHEPRLHCAQHRAFKSVAGNGALVGANGITLVTGIGAAIAVGIDLRVPAAACAAAQ